jgi:hypothetical protein
VSVELAQQVRWELALLVRAATSPLLSKQRRALRAVRGASGLKVNLGSGPLPHPGWLNVDGWSREADLVQRLGHELALPDRCASMVFSEHVLEHLEHPGQTRTFLAESFRILEPGGHIRIIVPDAENALRAYATGDAALLARLAPGTSGPIDAVNRLFREYGFHRFAWDYALAAEELGAAGFVGIRRAAFRDSPIVALNIDHDDQQRIEQSLYVEARRPLQ